MFLIIFPLSVFSTYLFSVGLIKYWKNLSAGDRFGFFIAIAIGLLEMLVWGYQLFIWIFN